MRLLRNSFAALNMLNFRKNNKLYQTFFHNGAPFSTTIFIIIVIAVVVIIIIVIIIIIIIIIIITFLL